MHLKHVWEYDCDLKKINCAIFDEITAKWLQEGSWTHNKNKAKPVCNEGHMVAYHHLSQRHVMCHWPKYQPENNNFYYEEGREP